MSFLPVVPAADSMLIVERRFRLRVAFALVFAASFFAWLSFNHAGPAMRKIVSDTSEVSCAALAAMWCFRHSGAFRNATTDFWQRLKIRQWGVDLIGAYLICYALGMGYWTYAELVLKQDAPFPSPADGFFILGYILLGAGILHLPSRKTTAILRGRVLLDGLMIITALITFSWYFVLGPTLIAGATSTFAKCVSLAYPLSDLALLICLYVMISRLPAACHRSIRVTLFLGMALYVVADSLYGYMTLKNTYASGSLIDVGWPLAQMLLACSVSRMRTLVYSAEDTEGDEEGKQQKMVFWRSLLPYAFVPALGALLVYTATHKGDEKLEPGVYIGCAILFTLLLLRQILAIGENQRLYKELEGKNAEVVKYASSLRGVNEELRTMQQQLLSNNQELAQANGRLQALATCDGMTGLFNHRTFQERLREEIALARTTGNPLSLLLLDVDKFKHYNDTYGHPAGDEALRIVARLLRENVRSTDLAARYGGEEFAVLLPDTDRAGTLCLAEKIRRAVEAYSFPYRAVTLSVGGVQWDQAIHDPETLIVSADEALYAAKHTGRNLAVIAQATQSVKQEVEAKEEAASSVKASAEEPVSAHSILPKAA